MTSTTSFGELYPDLAKGNGIRNALQLALRSIASPLEVTGTGVARVEKDHRSCQVYTSAEERLFLYDFWDRGVALAHASTPDLLEVARSIHAWVADRVNTAQIKKSFLFVRLAAVAEPFERGGEVAWKWEGVEETARTQPHMVDLLPLIVAARKSQELCQLFPFTSHQCLCLSRCTGYPYSGDCPHAVPIKRGEYQVFEASGNVVGSGDAERAVQLLVQHLPPNCGPATKGTAHDL